MVAFELLSGFDEDRTTYIHQNRHHHEFCVEPNERSVLGEPVLYDEALFDGAKEVVVKAGIDEQNEYLGNTVPNLIDANVSTIDNCQWRASYRR